jgi:putative ABC transport system permease protein
MRVVWTIAWRNTWRQRRRTILTMSTIALGLVLILVILGLSDGTIQQMVDSTVRMGSGHVLIQQQGYQESRAVERYLTGTEWEETEKLLAQPDLNVPVEHVTLRTFASGLASSADGSAGVQIIGIAPKRERPASRFVDALIEGRFLEEDDDAQAVIGSGVASRLAASPGARVVLMAQAADGELESMMVRVAGIVRTGLEELDDVLVLVPVETGRRLLALGEGVHQVAVLLGDAGDSEALATAMQARLEGVEVLDWARAHPELVDVVHLVGIRNAFLGALIFTLVAFLVLNTLLMAVMERTREFTLLDAVGLTPERRFATVMAEALVIAALASLIGLALGYGAHLYLATAGLPLDVLFTDDVALAGTMLDPVLYSHLSAARIFQALAVVFVMTLALALLPAARAARKTNIGVMGRN